MKESQMLKKFQNETYKTEPSMKKRLEIVQAYQRVERALNDYYEKKIDHEVLTMELGNVVLGNQGEHPSAQIYAYECLLRALSETQPTEEIATDAICEELFFDIAMENNPMKKAYLLGILRYYADKEAYDEIEAKCQRGELSGDEPIIADRIKIFSNLQTAAERFLTQDKTMEPIKEVAQRVKDDFPRGVPENEAARLVASHYSKEAMATRPPDPDRKSIVSDDQIWAGLGGNGIPRYVYVLPLNRHPSAEKLSEADNFGIKLDPQMARFEGDEKIFVDYDINPDLAQLYNRRIRHYKERENWERVDHLEEALKQRIWRDISAKDPQLAESLGGPGNVVVLKRTIRDYSNAEADREIREVLAEDEKNIDSLKKEAV